MKFTFNSPNRTKIYYLLLCVPLLVVFPLVLILGSKPIPAQNAPYPPSVVVNNITWDFDNLVRLAPGSDLWPTTWAADNNIYTSWGDGGGFGGTNTDGRVSLGFARIKGPPENFEGFNVWGGKRATNPATFTGKSVGMLAVDGVLYAWINLQNGNPPDEKLAWSSDLGKNWQFVEWKFPEDNLNLSTFLNFGIDYAGARDGYVYSYGGQRGSTNDVYLARVSQNQIKDRNAYEFFKGLDANSKPMWTLDITQRIPVFTDSNLANELNGTLKASVIYNPGINRYILTIPHGGVGRLGIFDAPEPWGPWTTVAYYDNWGGFGAQPEGLIYACPTKWLSADGKTMRCIFSGPGEMDSFNLLEATIFLKSDLPFNYYLPSISSDN